MFKSSKMGLICREAKVEEIEKIVQFQIAMALETEKLRLDPDTCRRGVSAVFEQPFLGKYYVGERDGEIVSSLLIIPEWSDWRNAMVWWIHSVYVIPSARGNGVFSEMYRMIQKKGEEQGNLRGLRLYVDKTNRVAQNVYMKLGMDNRHYELFEWIK